MKRQLLHKLVISSAILLISGCAQLGEDLLSLKAENDKPAGAPPGYFSYKKAEQWVQKNDYEMAAFSYCQAAELGHPDAKTYCVKYAFLSARANTGDVCKAEDYNETAKAACKEFWQGNRNSANEMVWDYSKKILAEEEKIAQENQKKKERLAQKQKAEKQKKEFNTLLASSPNKPEDQLRLAEMYLTGTGTRVNQTDAKIWLGKASDQGNFTAKEKLAKLLSDESSPEGLSRAKELFLEISQAGKVEGTVGLAKLALKENNAEESVRLFEKAIKESHNPESIKKEYRKIFTSKNSCIATGMAILLPLGDAVAVSYAIMPIEYKKMLAKLLNQPCFKVDGSKTNLCGSPVYTHAMLNDVKAIPLHEVKVKEGFRNERLNEWYVVSVKDLPFFSIAPVTKINVWDKIWIKKSNLKCTYPLI